MKRIYHHYKDWEDFKFGFYDSVTYSKKQDLINSVVYMFSDPILTERYMEKVIDDWVYSCEHNLSNENMNRVAYLGQAACCLYCGAPCDVTMRAWKELPIHVQLRSNEIAKKTIIKWARRIRSRNTLTAGKRRGMKTGYQTKLPFS